MTEEYRNKNTPLVAVIVPVYNDEPYLRGCLDSIKHQTAPFWEAWVIDDCSQDGCPDIIREYCAADLRFHALRNEVNCGAWTSRAKGILSVSPSVRYIMFADADDALQLNAVERAYQLMEDDPVDILHFGVNIGNFANRSNEDIQKLTAYYHPLLTKLEGREIFDNTVVQNFKWQLWNKMFRAALLREVIQSLGVDRVLPRGQDMVLYWAVCWQREDLTYRGVEDRLYTYNFGLGEDGRPGHITLEQYRRYLTLAWAMDANAEIVANHPQEADKYSEALGNLRLHVMRNVVRAFTRLLSQDQAVGLDLLPDYWKDPLDGARFFSSAAVYTRDCELDFADAVAMSRIFSAGKKSTKPKVIGTYSSTLANGGIQRVIAQLMTIWHKLGYEIVVFTDYEPDERDYSIPDYVKRVVIGQSKYEERGMILAKLLAEYNVDYMVYNTYYSRVLLYDICVCKSMNVSVLIYVHTVFTRFAREADARFSSLSLFVQLADGLICLDDTSTVWWKQFNNNVQTVLNPLTFSLSDVIPTKQSNHNILFLCRFDENAKRPYDAITIAQDLASLLPDVKLYMVGTGEEEYVAGLHTRIAELGLQDNIIMTGFTKDVEEYYRRCSVLLLCSALEGWAMTISEALSFGLPVVMYDLPYLRLVQNNPGVFRVKQRDTGAAVHILYELLTDPDRLRAAGDAGRRYLEEVYSADFGEQWKRVFDSVGCVKDNDAVMSGTKAMCHTLVRDYYDGAKKMSAQVTALKKKLAYTQKELDSRERSISFRVGRAITFIPRKLRNGPKRIFQKFNRK